MNPIWVICPVLNNLQMSLDAIGDFLDQSVPTRVLVINQGSTDEVRAALEREAELKADRLFIWNHCPPLPSLSASWNRALDFVWETGGTKALVVNNDVRLHPYTITGLMGAMNVSNNLFVSAVAVTQEQFEAGTVHIGRDLDPKDPMYWYDYAKRQVTDKGGPDFSCFLISKAGHQKYRFDESFIPAYCEDLDTHRRFMLGGDGDKIFSVNLPYLHFASGTLKAMTPEQRAKKEAAIAGSRNYYRQKWGGEVNQETFYQPFGAVDAIPEYLYLAKVGPTTPDLQTYWQSR